MWKSGQFWRNLQRTAHTHRTPDSERAAATARADLVRIVQAYCGEYTPNFWDVLQGGAVASLFDVCGAVGKTAWLRVNFKRGAGPVPAVFRVDAWCGKRLSIVCCAMFILKTMILPRQARDKHKKKLTERAFSVRRTERVMQNGRRVRRHMELTDGATGTILSTAEGDFVVDSIPKLPQGAAQDVDPEDVAAVMGCAKRLFLRHFMY